MELKEKFQELLLLLTGFVSGQKSGDELQSFAWEVIEYFTDTPLNELPAEEEFEKVFWYAIWNIQHLCDDSHQDNGTAKRELSEVLAYMRGEKEIPDCCIGRRP